MSVYQDRVLTCPRCGRRETRSVAVSLNGARAARQRQEILDGTFQRFACEGCHEVYRADGPLIYIDFDTKLWIGVFPEPWERRWWLYEQEPERSFGRNMLESCPPMVREWAPGFAIRTVFGLEGLREKLIAHAAGIDDRALEAYKLDLLRGMGPYELSPAARPRLREVEDGRARFRVPRPDPADLGRVAEVAVPRAEIERVTRDPEWAGLVGALAEGPYVDLGRVLIPRDGDEERRAPTPAGGPALESNA